MDKSSLLQECYTILTNRLSQIETALHAAEASLQEETKSSAGDKYETSREMIQQDLDRLEKQRRTILDEQAILDRISSQNHSSSHIGLGSVVMTEDGSIYFVSIGLGKITAFNKPVFAVSLSSPIGKQLQEKKKNDFFEMNSIKKKIINVI